MKLYMRIITEETKQYLYPSSKILNIWGGNSLLLLPSVYTNVVQKKIYFFLQKNNISLVITLYICIYIHIIFIYYILYIICIWTRYVSVVVVNRSGRVLGQVQFFYLFNFSFTFFYTYWVASLFLLLARSRHRRPFTYFADFIYEHVLCPRAPATGEAPNWNGSK